MAAGLIAIAVAIVLLSGMRPGYDAFGWLVWGKQVLHWNLNTDAAPSWKPMTFLFTLPYAVFGRAQMTLWLITAVAGCLAGPVFAGRIAHRLTGPSPGRPWAPWLAAAFAAAGVLGISGLWRQTMIANSDPIIVTLCLAAIDLHLSGRPRWAFAAIVLAALGRPELWPFALLYAPWLLWKVRAGRIMTLLGLLLIPLLWFAIPALTSKSWFHAGDLALSTINKVNIIHGSKIEGVLDRFWALTELPMQLAALAALGVAAVRRDLRPLGLAAAAGLWVMVEIGFALRGYSGASRYLFEPAAVMVVLAAVAVGQALAFAPTRPHRVRAAGALAGLIGPAAALALLAVLISPARERVRTIRGVVEQANADGRQIDRLHDTIEKAGGAERIKGCGEPVTLVGNQSAVAWETGLNVGNVGYRPGREIRKGRPVIVLKPHRGGWQVRPYNLSDARCASLRIDSDFDS